MSSIAGCVHLSCDIIWLQPSTIYIYIYIFKYIFVRKTLYFDSVLYVPWIPIHWKGICRLLGVNIDWSYVLWKQACVVVPSGLILGVCLANEGCHYKGTPSHWLGTNLESTTCGWCARSVVDRLWWRHQDYNNYTLNWWYCMLISKFSQYLPHSSGSVSIHSVNNGLRVVTCWCQAIT